MYILFRTLTARSRVLVGKTIVVHLVKKFPTFMGSEDSVPFLQDPATETYPEPVESAPHLYIIFLYDLF
jgi:hypothetical protein